LQHIIESSGINIADLADIFGSSEVTSQILAGRRLIDVMQAQALANRFKLSPQTFLD
jgi:antitoxin component HigA of HigAB toxin-antitoxin module